MNNGYSFQEYLKCSNLFFFKLNIAFTCLITFLCIDSFGAASAGELGDKWEYSYRLSFDKHMSSKASSDLTLSSLELYRQVEDTVYQKNDSFAQVLVSLSRYLVAEFFTTANHEVGGHGARGREFGVPPTRYDLGIFSGTTYFPNQMESLPIYKKIMIDTAGVQANYLLSQNIKFRYLESNEINPTYGIAYVVSKMEQPEYIFSIRDTNKAGHDIGNYLRNVNQLYGDNYLRQSKLKNYAYLDLVDPFLFYSLYSFVLDKKINTPFLMLNDNIGYLPAMHAVLAPYGPEIGLLNLLKVNSNLVEIELSYGSNSGASSYGLGIKDYGLVHFDRFTLGGQLRVWSQPDFIAKGEGILKKRWGGLIASNGQFNVNKHIGIAFEVGYKSAGFVLGESPDADVFTKSSLLIRF